jgi:serine/threonine protein kinase
LNQQYRAPEENRDEYLNEKIDIYSFGNNIYGLLTGLWVFYDTDDDATVQVRDLCVCRNDGLCFGFSFLLWWFSRAQKKVNNGERAFIDKRYRTRSYAEGKLVELMENCWLDDPAKRVDIFEAVRFLQKSVKENKKMAT